MNIFNFFVVNRETGEEIALGDNPECSIEQVLYMMSQGTTRENYSEKWAFEIREV